MFAARSRIPYWLTKSELQRHATSLSLTLQPELFHAMPHLLLPADQMPLVRDNSNINNLADFVSVVRCVDYWGVDYDSWPSGIYAFAASNVADVQSWRDDSGSAIAQHVDFSDELLMVLSTHLKCNHLAQFAALGSTGWMKLAHENGCPFHITVSFYAAREGQLDCLMYAALYECPWDKRTSSSAAAGGHLSCLQYVHKNGCPWDENTCTLAAAGGSVACLKYAHENGCPWDVNTCINAASRGHLSCLKYAHEHGCPWESFTCTFAAQRGHLSCLKYAHENGCPWAEETCRAAAEGRAMSCLKYARDHGCPCDEWTLLHENMYLSTVFLTCLP